MRTSLFLILLSFFFGSSSGQAIITKPTTLSSVKSISDFGAIAGDGNDDTWAFIKAGKYFSNLWDINGVPLGVGIVNFDYALYSAKLTIPSGTYDVGKQIAVPPAGLSTTYGAIFGYPAATAPITIPVGSAYKYGFELMVLSNPSNNIDQILIEGTGIMPVIRYSDTLRFGYFDDSGTPLFFPPTSYDPKYAVGVGSLLSTFDCKNVVLNNIEIDGNNTPTFSGGNTYYDGGWIDHFIQTGASGVLMIDTRNVSLTDLVLHHMTLDGILYKDSYKDPVVYPGQPLSNLLIDNVKSDYNRRQGFSWVGGRGITVTNSRFNHTGTTVSGVAAGNPGAGLDIEPEQDAFGNYLWCMDGSFTNCQFVNNKGLGVGNDNPNNSKNMTFTNCKFHDVDSYALWVKGKTYQFNDCQIWGGFAYGNEGLINGEETVFNNCDFADEEIPGRPGVYNAGYALIESWLMARKTQFNDCSFRTLHSNQRLAAIWTASSTESDFTVFRNCNFTVSSISNGANAFYGCSFDGDNDFVSNNVSQVENISINGLVLRGSNDPCNTNDLTLAGRILFVPANTNGGGLTQFLIGRDGTSGTDGFSKLTVGADACLYTHWSQTIDIGKNSQLINKTDGQIVTLDGTWNNDGKIILDNGSYTSYAYPVVINTSVSTNPEFYYHKNAVTGLNSLWAGVFAGYPATPVSGLTLSSNTRFDGGNTTVPVGYESSINDAVLFDGINDYIQILNPSAISKLSNYALSNAFSIEIAYKHEDNGNQQVLFSHGSQFFITLNGNTLQYQTPYNNGSVTSSVLDGECHYLTLTRETDNYIRIYIDGKLIHNSMPATHAGTVSSASDIILASHLLSRTQMFKGWIGQLRVWSRALSQNDICYNHQNKAPFSTSNIVGVWDMRDASGTTVTDAVATAISGTMINGASWVTQNTVGDCVKAAYQNNRSIAPVISKINTTIIPFVGRSTQITVFPNPAHGDFKLHVNGITNKKIQLQVFDINGRIVSEEYISISPGQKDLQKNMKILKKGIFLLKVKDGDKSYTDKIIRL